MPDAFSEPGEALIQSVLNYPPCRCGGATCPDATRTVDGDESRRQRPDGHRDSRVLRDLRSRVRDDNARRRCGR